jgi:hypothetical protein
VSFTAERLYELLPAIYRIRDAEQGKPLAALLDLVADQVAVLEENMEQLYDDQFVETAAPWVLPYLGDLLGIAGLPAEPLTPRAEVAHTIAYRRRKGTAAMLEQLARDATGLPARADESFELLATTQYLNHRRPENLSFLSVRDADRLEHLGTAFERLDGQTTLCHNVDARRIASGRGRYNIPNVGIFLWRLRAYPLTRSPARPDTAGNKRRFRFSPLGNDAPLFTLPRTEDVLTHLAEPLDVPGPISRRALHAAVAAYYGDSFLIERPGATAADDPVPVPVADVVACDLSEWTPHPAAKVAVDPVLGRLLFAADEAAPPLVTFHYGFQASLGGGEYDRTVAGGEPVLRVAARNAQFDKVQEAIDALGGGGGVVEIADSGRYEEALALDASNRRVIVRAASGNRPSIVLKNDLHLRGGPGDAVTLDGLLVSGASVVVDAGAGGADGLGTLELRHCTLVPGVPASLSVESSGTDVRILQCIVGGVRAALDSKVQISSSVVDATDEASVAYADPTGKDYGAPLQIESATVLGRVKTDVLELASNSIFLAAAAVADPAWPAPVLARRRQDGCVRFCYLPPGAQTPRRFRCQPESDADAARVRPVFTSRSYGAPGYVQLAVETAPEIRRGADDESELGVFHDLHLPQREAHLRARLDEYLRFGLEAGVFYAT